MSKAKFLIGTMLGMGLTTTAAAQQAPTPAASQPAQTTTAEGPSNATNPATVTDVSPADIVVTAQKRSERLQEVPLAVSVVSGAALSTASRPSIETATLLVPALNFLKSGTTLNQTIFLRGVGTATFSIAGEPSVSTVVDGVVYARSGEAFTDLVDTDQMEVLRGPQGTLFGKNASAGVINITTKRPTATAGGSVEAGYFEGNEFRLRGTVNVPLGDQLLSRVTAFYGKYDGNIRNVTLGTDVNGYKRWGVRGQLLFQPRESTVRLLVIGDYYKNNDDCCAEVIGTYAPLTATLGGTNQLTGFSSTNPVFTVLPTPLGDKTRQVAQNLVTRTQERGWGLSAQVDVDVGTNTLTSITAYRDWNNTEIRDGDFLPRAYVGFNELHDRGPQQSTTLSQEIRLTSPGNQFFTYVLGGYFSRAKAERIFNREDIVCTAAAGAPTGVLIPCGGPNATPSTFPGATADFGSTFTNAAAFGQGVVNLTDAFRVVVGLRYTHDKLSVFHSRNTRLAGPGIQASFPVTTTGTGQPATQFRAKTSESNVSGKVAVQYDLTKDVMAYASYTRGYKGPAYNVFFNLNSTGTNVIDPETVNSYEAGLKNSLMNGRLVVNLTAFSAKYKNFQANNPDVVAGVVVTRFTNAGSVSTKGAELDLNFQPVRDLTFSGGLAYTKAQVEAFRLPPGALPSQVVPSGTRLGYAPKWKGSLSADYRVRDVGPVDIFLGASTSTQTKQLAQFSPDPVVRKIATIQGYSITNATIGIGGHMDEWRVTLLARNLFDKSYAAAIQSGGPAGAYRFQIPRDADRYIGVTGRFNFGGGR
ncbi:TonB-dependent receptor [Sphingomonas humi]|uniref:TonB-dependent receptor n=1 Tax=Sphingomonas humi TaxID=335630 RepID=A0ABP7S9A2_9SPHN